MSSSISVQWTDGCEMEFLEGSWSVAKEIGGLSSDQKIENVTNSLAPSSRKSRASAGPLRKLMLSPPEDCFGQCSGLS
ncbi:hypothetical protein RHSIM_Rhsim09G0031100 [Rhododendron simsii]|uniref:Uncharacterized protein n=1 Tax=Rhododendron simsii TaxID=118357 RepID=A0A834GIP7_RHOSS|nr:hypothetical protein RHSIM_Rhsim09G0031100 [Rhododendron simsii]